MSTLVGKEVLNFNDRETGEKVKGIRLHYLCADNRVSGQMAATQFLRSDHACYDKAVQMPLGEFQLIFGPRGRVMDIVSSVPAGNDKGK